MRSLVLLTVIAIVATAPNPLLNSKQTPTSSYQRISPEIINELKDFLHLIPRVTIEEIVAKHYVIDGGFRNAANYLRSSEFTELSKNVQRIPDIIEILRFLQLENNAVAGRASSIDVSAPVASNACWQQQLANIIDNLPLQIELLPIVDGVGGNLYSFSSFVEEIIEHLPRDKYTQMINEKRQRSAPFAAFYAALRSSQFEVLIDAALKSPTLAQTLQTLNNHEIYASSLKPIAFKVISWGPSV